jgi:hypothetical protein
VTGARVSQARGTGGGETVQSVIGVIGTAVSDEFKEGSASFGKDSPATAAACCTPDAETGEVDAASQPEGCCA